MRKQLGDRLPEFTPEEAELVKGSNDFYGMNHYCANYIKHKDTEPELDDHVGNMEILMQNKEGEWIGPETQSAWLRPMPLGFRKLIKWLSDRYGGPTFYVTENGTSLKGENELPLEELLNDDLFNKPPYRLSRPSGRSQWKSVTSGSMPAARKSLAN